MTAAAKVKRAGERPKVRVNETRRVETVRLGKRGTVVIPARLRKRFRLTEGSYVVFEPQEDGMLIRPAVLLPIETYTPERKAEFLLSNAADAADYARAVKEVRKMGLNPEKIEHFRPKGA